MVSINQETYENGNIYIYKLVNLINTSFNYSYKNLLNTFYIYKINIIYFQILRVNYNNLH